jgi:hypothetical protein
MNNTITLYRAMRADINGFPQCGNSARALGVRTEGERIDIEPDDDGFVEPGKNWERQE